MTTEHKIIGGIGLLTITILIVSIFIFSSKNSKPPIPNDQIITQKGLHWHSKLAVIIKGEKQGIPSDLGITGQIHQELHTHDKDAKDGVVHMEMKGLVTKDETKLGNFFRIWGKEFSSIQIFDKKNSTKGIVKMTVNGKENSEFEKYQMRDGDTIEIKYE